MPAAENPTVAMVEAAYRHHGIDARYLNCEVAPEALGDAVRGATGDGLGGLQLLAAPQGRGDRAPRRRSASRPRSSARSTPPSGATARWIGENTDGQGFMAALRTVVDPAGKSLVILGAGGAARAIAVEAALAGAA